MDGEPTDPDDAPHARRPVLVLVIGAVVLGALAAGIALGLGREPLASGGVAAVLDAVRLAFAELQQAPPLVFFSVMSLVCLLPVPISAFYVAAGPVYGVVPSLLWILPALVVNMLLGHLAATSLLRPHAVRLLARRGQALPTASDPALLIALVRLTPGVPFFLQNLMLGLARVDRVPYLLISLPIQMAFATGFVLLGESAFEGRVGAAATALGVIVLASFAARLLHRRLRSQAAEAAQH